MIAAAPSRDEDPAEHQRQHDADQQDGLLELPGHREAAHDDDEDEQVVDRERVLGQPPGVELPRVLRAGEDEDAEAEHQRHADEEDHGDRWTRASIGSCGRRPITNTSIARPTARTAIVAIQTQAGMFKNDLRSAPCALHRRSLPPEGRCAGPQAQMGSRTRPS